MFPVDELKNRSGHFSRRVNGNVTLFLRNHSRDFQAYFSWVSCQIRYWSLPWVDWPFQKYHLKSPKYLSRNSQRSSNITKHYLEKPSQYHFFVVVKKKTILNHLVQNEVKGVNSGTWKIIALALYIFRAGIRWTPLDCFWHRNDYCFKPIAIITYS